MTLRLIIITVLLLLFSGGIFGQEQKKKSKSKRQTNAELLEEAKALQKKDPAGAIVLLEQVIRQNRKKKGWQDEAEAYVLLGNIYKNIKQNDLALERYRQAIGMFNQSKNRNQLALIYADMGEINLVQKDSKGARSNFNLCIKESRNKTLTLRCKEGLADVEQLLGDIDASNFSYQSVKQEAVKDSLVVARIEAKQAQNYVKQNDYSRAKESYDNSVRNIPRNQSIKKEDIVSIEKAKEDLIKYSNSKNLNEIEATKNTALAKSDIKLPPDVVIKENLKLAELYEDENNFPEAEKLIKVSKDAIDKETPAASVAEVFKRSRDLNRKKGAMEDALADLEKYIEAKEQAIQNLEEDLQEQIEIVKGQQNIDLLQRDFDLEQKDKDLLTSQMQIQKTVIGLLSLLLLASLVFFYFLTKNVKAKRKANQLLLLKSLRTQMNPHFIFNALNSVNNFIAKNDEKAANKFLSEFSRLMRKVLDNSQKDFIAFDEEIELNQLYLKLEHFRFRDKFEYSFSNNLSFNNSFTNTDLEVPPMLIQPFIENAVWHGLRYKDSLGKLEVSIDGADNQVIVKIKDNGIGRKKSKALKTENQKKYKSTGLVNVSRRIELINEIYKKNYQIKIEDLDASAEDTGTLVTINIPFYLLTR